MTPSFSSPPLLPPPPAPKPRRLPVAAASLLIVAHAALIAYSLCINWSSTDVLVDTPGRDGEIEQISIPLYPSTFWTNVDNFESSGAWPLAYLLVLTGVGQPAIKSLVLPLLLLPSLLLLCGRSRSALLTPARRRKVLLTQELTSKLTTTTSNVGVLMLSIITLTFHLQADPRLHAVASTDTDWGTVLYLYGSVLSCVAVSLLRDLHTAALPAPPTPSPKAKRGMLGTLSLLLIFLFLIPTCTLPLVRFEYSGVAAALIDDADETAEGKLMRELKIYDIGRNLYNDTPEKFIAYNNTFFFYLTCFVCPLIALLAAAAHRQTPSPTLLRITRYSFALSCIDTLVVAMVFAAPEIELIAAWVFDGTQLCEVLASDTDSVCLSIRGRVLAGGWCAAALAFFFDVFVFATLWEEGRREDDEERRAREAGGGAVDRVEGEVVRDVGLGGGEARGEEGARLIVKF